MELPPFPDNYSNLDCDLIDFLHSLRYVYPVRDRTELENIECVASTMSQNGIIISILVCTMVIRGVSDIG